jgi:hypothetical protein
MSRNQQVVRYGWRWAIRKEGNTRVTRVFNSKEKAISKARTIARNTASSVVICNSTQSLGEANKIESVFF